MERLEEDMFQAQVDIGEAEIEISSLEISMDEIQYTLQETIETVFFDLSSQFRLKITPDKKSIGFSQGY